MSSTTVHRKTAGPVWRPTPFREFVLKVHQRCNLACDYCYVYTKRDQSWRSRIEVMPPEIRQAAAFRIREHALTHQLSSVNVILHGGEPLLCGAADLVGIAQEVRRWLPSHTAAHIGVQTNGVLLTRDVLDEFLEHDIHVAVSLDGSARDHDRHRRHPNGRGSFDETERALDLLASDRYRQIYTGLLCTIDGATDPVECYRALLAHRPPAIDVLLPHENWDTRRPASDLGPWLTRFFDEYFDAREQPTRVRLFEELIALMLGGSGGSDQLGLAPAAVVVIESDGAIEQTDSLKSAYPGAAGTGLRVQEHTFDEALGHPGMVARQRGRDALCARCRECKIVHLCGGGHYSHRYRTGTGFDNPSVFCADLQVLIGHVYEKLRARILARLR